MLTPNEVEAVDEAVDCLMFRVSYMAMLRLPALLVFVLKQGRCRR